MPQNYAASVQGAAIRVTRLNADGTLATGDLDSYTTAAFMRLSFTPEYEDGEEITEKAANGTVCVSYKAPDRLKRVTMELAICEPDPELSALIAGGVLLARNEYTTVGTLGTTPTALVVSSAAIVSSSTATANIAVSITGSLGASPYTIAVGDNITLSGITATSQTNTAVALNAANQNGVGRVVSITGSSIVVTVGTPVTFTTAVNQALATSSPTITKRNDVSVGWAAPGIGDDPAGNGVAIEVWSFAVADGKRAATNPWFKWVFPYARLRQSGDRVIENGLLANTFEGYAIGNTAFSAGCDGRWEFTEVNDRPYAYARVGWSPSSYNLRGFYTWNTTTGAYTAVTNLPAPQVDTGFNVPGGAAFDISATAPVDITVSDN